jgi:hypothetical protein
VFCSLSSGSGIGLVDIVKRVLDVRRGAEAFRGEEPDVMRPGAGICLSSVFCPLSSGSDRVAGLRPGGFAEPWVVLRSAMHRDGGRREGTWFLRLGIGVI